MKCDVCGSNKVTVESNSILYGKQYGTGKCFYCHDCGASITQATAGHPKGKMASKNTRILRKTCHNLFDPVWKYEMKISRSNAYKKLANMLEIDKQDCHFSLFQTDMCLKAISIISEENWWAK